MRTRRFEREEAKAPPPGLVNICGILARVSPAQAEAVRARFAALQGVEVHAVTDDGRLVVVIEDSPESLAIDRLRDLETWPDVPSWSLVFHHFENQDALDRPLPNAVHGEILA